MNEKNIKALLKGIGLESVLTEIEKDDFDANTAVSKFNEGQKAHYRDIIKNEIAPEIETEITAKVEGKIYNTFRNDIKKSFGVPLDKLKDKFPNEMLAIAKTHIDETYSKNPNAEEMKKLQEELIETRNAYTELEGKLPKEIERIQKEEKQKTVSKLTGIELQKKYNSIPADKLLGKSHAPGYYVAMKADLYEKYDFGIDENENPIPYVKGTSQRATSKDANGKESFANIDELVLNSLDTLGFINKSNGGEGSGNSGKGGNGGSAQQKSQRMIELEQKAKASAA